MPPMKYILTWFVQKLIEQYRSGGLHNEEAECTTQGQTNLQTCFPLIFSGEYSNLPNITHITNWTSLHLNFNHNFKFCSWSRNHVLYLQGKPGIYQEGRNFEVRCNSSENPLFNVQNLHFLRSGMVSFFLFFFFFFL
ncbi:hypothetical protein V6Z11_A06G037600 [Gossypium hirsutum]